jgi:phenylacetate-CoA ligase
MVTISLVVTSLTNRLMPFIRYKLGDSGRLLDGECACGSPFPLMEMGLCRQNDWIRGQAGQRIHPGVFNRMLDGQTQIRQYQWVQTKLDRIELNLVSSEKMSAETQAALTDKIRQAMGAEVVLDVNYLDEIPPQTKTASCLGSRLDTGGACRSRTDLHGFAIRCITALLTRRDEVVFLNR